MTINDILQGIIIGLSLLGVALWLIKLRNWPLAISAIVAFLLNLLVYLVRLTGSWTPADLNQFSLVRILLLSLVLCVVPLYVDGKIK